MDYEKEYKKLVGKIKKAYLYAQTDSTKAVLEDILPELRESEDERIRKGLLKMFNHYVRNNIELIEYDLDKDMVLAWLEKQKEFVSADFDDVWKTTDCDELTAPLEKYSKDAIKKMCHAWYDKGIELERKSCLEKQGEQKLTNSYCQEHCKGFQETGKCFADGDCKAKTTYKDELKEDNRPVTERIKTFDDACQELNTKAHSGDNEAAILLVDYESNADNINNPQTLAYMRLAIIAYALNEGWEPKFEKGECRYFPWFYFYTKEQYDELDDEGKGRCVLLSGSSTNANNGFVFCSASYDASFSHTNFGSRLVFRTRELAEYAGKQFAEEWADFVFKTE